MRHKGKIDERAILDALGNQIRTRRTKADISQTELGEYLGISFQQIQKYERGTNRLPAPFLFHLSKFFHCNIQDFFGDLINGGIAPGTREDEPIQKSKTEYYLIAVEEDGSSKFLHGKNLAELVAKVGKPKKR